MAATVLTFLHGVNAMAPATFSKALAAPAIAKAVATARATALTTRAKLPLRSEFSALDTLSFTFSFELELRSGC